MEALNALLIFIHQTPFNDKLYSSNLPCKPKCPAHSNFELLVEETLTCACGASNKSKWDYSTFSQHFYVNEVFEEISESAAQALLVVDETEEETCFELSNVVKTEGRLQEYIKSQWCSVKYPICPAECPEPKSTKVLRLLTMPKVFIVNLIWKDFRPSLLKILQVFASISMTVSMDNLYECDQCSVHTLKSIILYGSGHYICAIKLDGFGWSKIDDENVKVVGKGEWKDLVEELVKGRFFPVGLFYEENRGMADSGISPQEWMRLERIVLEGVKVSQETMDDSEWECECGGKNHYYWKICKDCNKIRSNIKGWACKNCTFINENFEFSCEACGSTKTLTPSTLSECPKCGKLKKSDSSACACSKECRKCKTLNCKNCNSGYECKVCSEFIPKDELFYCIHCKFKSKNKSKCDNCSRVLFMRNMICEPCLSTLWKCTLCSSFNPQNEINCLNSTCTGKRFKSEQMNFNKVQRLAKPSITQCSACGVKQKNFRPWCLNCKIQCIGLFCEFCKEKCKNDLCDNCAQVTAKCQSCSKNYFFMDYSCPYCKLS